MTDNDSAFLDIFSPEFKIVQSATREMSLRLFDYIDDIIRQIGVEGRSAGLDKVGIQYLTWIIFEADSKWPPMTDRQKWTLTAMRNLVNRGFSKPDTHLLGLPPPEDEDKVDRAIMGLVRWFKTGLGPKLKKDWDKILDRSLSKVHSLGYQKDSAWLDERIKEAILKQSASIPLNRFLIPLFFYIFE